jgi:hypothetical protein
MAGLVTQVVSAPVVMLFDAASYLVSALFLSRVDRNVEWPAPERSPTSVRREIRSGLSFVARHRELRALIGTTAISNLCTHIAFGVLITFLARELRWSALAIGVIFALKSVAAIVLTSRTGWFSNRPIGRVLAAAQGTIAAGLLLASVATDRWGYGAVFVGLSMYEVAVGVSNSVQLSYRAIVTPPEFRGRMQATARMVVVAGLVLGFVLAGVLGPIIGLRTTMVVGGLLQLTAVGVVVFSPIWSIASMPTEGSAKPHRWLDIHSHLWTLIPDGDFVDHGIGHDPLLLEAEELARRARNTLTTSGNSMTPPHGHS